MSQGHPRLFCESCRKTRRHRIVFALMGRHPLTCFTCRSSRTFPRKAVPEGFIQPAPKEK